ncbi:MAG TPA: S8 family serine peptidase, partial [Miltoncostaeaceae bacterium]|nr:S8 family serine peptidase [Miltoncostaeaceae bacterium]
MLGGRLIAAVVAATAATLPLAPSADAAPASAVLVRVAPAGAADVLGPAARPALPPASVARLERRVGRRLPELRGLYRIRADGPAAARRIASRLDARPAVRAAVEPAPVPPPAVCRPEPDGGWPVFDPGTPTPDLSGFQDYRAGMDVPDTATGAGVRVGDIEYEWRRTHEELAERALPAPVRRPGGLPGFLAEDHGTAVLGILGADIDGEGTTGVAHDAQILPLSPFFEPDPDSYDLPRAVLEAALALRPGDVLLIEQQTTLETPSGPVFAPVEADPVMRDLIRDVVDAGVVVVEPAGNGGRDLASLNLSWLADPADPANSGALLVAGGESPATGVDLARTPGSNYGARVDLQGYGAGVVTTGYGLGIGPVRPEDRAYTSCFDGTSSASANVAGAVAALQGLAIDATGSPATPAAVRAALVATGKPQAGPAEERIGPRPQVAAAATLLGAIEPPAGPGPPPAPPLSALPVQAPPPSREQ